MKSAVTHPKDVDDFKLVDFIAEQLKFVAALAGLAQ